MKRIDNLKIIKYQISISLDDIEKVIKFIQDLWVNLIKNNFNIFLDNNQIEFVNQLSQNFKKMIIDKVFI